MRAPAATVIARALAGAAVVSAAAVLAAPAPAAAPAQHHTAAGTKVARASLLTLKDLGKGWQAGQAGQPGLRLVCPGWRPSGAGVVETGAAGSPDFAAGGLGPFVLQTSSTYATAAQAAAYWQRAARPGLVTCVTQTVEAIGSQGVKVKITHQGPLVVSKAAPHSAAFRVVATLGTAARRSQTLYFDVILLGKGTTLTEITLSSFVAPIPAKVENALATLVAHRLGGLPTA